jgi:hypothetical protein
MVNAKNVSSGKIDPQLAQAILDKVASGQALLPAEKIAIGKLPPSLIQHAAMSGTAPMAPSAPASANAFNSDNYGGAPGGKLAFDVPKSGNSEGQAVGPDVGGRSFGPPAGDSAENNGLLPSQHYAGKAYYQGSGMVDPVAQAPATVTPVAPPASSKLNLPIASQVVPDTSTPDASHIDASPTVQTAKAIAASPEVQAAAPSLKGMKGQDIAKMIGSILDVVGVGLSARGGVQRQTMLQQQMQMQRQVQANLAEKKGEAGIDIDKAAALSPIQVEQARQVAHNTGDIDTENAIRLKQGIAPIDLSNAKDLAAYSSDLDENAKMKLYTWMQKHGINFPGNQVPLSLTNNPYQMGVSGASSLAGPQNP